MNPTNLNRVETVIVQKPSEHCSCRNGIGVHGLPPLGANKDTNIGAQIITNTLFVFFFFFFFGGGGGGAGVFLKKIV